MELNFNNIKIDYARLEAEVRQKAQVYLDSISEENLKAFIDSTRFIAYSVIEDYYFTVDDYYTNGKYKIESSETLHKFIDFYDGYRAQMRKWVSENNITIKEMKFNSPRIPEENDDNNITKNPKIVTGIGTLISVGLCIFKEVWVAVATELLTLTIAAYTYKLNKESYQKKYVSKIIEIELQIEREKEHFIAEVIREIKVWLEQAEVFSNEIILKMGIQ